MDKRSIEMSSCCDSSCHDENIEARHLWLNGSSHNDESGDQEDPADRSKTIMERVESMYRQTLSTNGCCCEHQRDAKEKLALILVQSGRHQEADAMLESLGFTCRLALDVFKTHSTTTLTYAASTNPHTPNSYCRVFDHMLPENELRLLQEVFSNIHGSYWTDHNYQVEPPSPYYSYVLPLKETITGTLEAIIHRLRNHLKTHFPSLKTATVAEVWAHNRPHATGHQFHFDSDNEGCTVIIRNPIVSCVLYLSHGVGGPTVVTNQRLSSRGLATTAWLVPASISNRLVAFDGKLLHGVVPGAGSNTDRRVSLMVAFWKSIRLRQEKGAAACQWPAPGTTSWADSLMEPSSSSESGSITITEVLPIPISPVYEAVPGGGPWARSKGMPDYELLFQGM